MSWTISYYVLVTTALTSTSTGYYIPGAPPQSKSCSTLRLSRAMLIFALKRENKGRLACGLAAVTVH